MQPLSRTHPLILRDNEGYLLNPDDWTEDLAEALALEAELDLVGEQREIVWFVREYFEQHLSVPEARKVLKFMKEQWGAEKATRKYLYKLFPRGYAQQACKVAGMRKPLKLMLDL
jgi:tRNA 2-thiouridine synthesizing protein E